MDDGSIDNDAPTQLIDKQWLIQIQTKYHLLGSNQLVF